MSLTDIIKLQFKYNSGFHMDFHSDDLWLTTVVPRVDCSWCRWTVMSIKAFAANMEFLDTPPFSGFPRDL